MTQRIYKTANGKSIDIGAMLLQNENVRAVGVGTQPINARGDLINSRNQPIDTRTQQVSRQYNKQISNVNSDPVQSSQVAAAAAMPPAPPIPKENFVENPPPLGGGGLAAAIAKARNVTQEPIRTPKQAAQAAAGVKKI